LDTVWPVNLSTRLIQLEYEAQSIVMHCASSFQRTGMLWSMGKDSTALLWMVKKLFPEGIPFPLFHIDTSFKIPEMIRFREQIRQEWNLPLKVFSNQTALSQGMNPGLGKQNCCKTLKTEPLLQLIAEERLQCLLIGIRRDEEGSRSKERYFSLRAPNGAWNYTDQETEVAGLWPVQVAPDSHFRVHPLLSWMERDIWDYIRAENIPFSSLYSSKENFRYRSLGCAPCTKPFASSALSLNEIITELSQTKFSERAGRAQDSEVSYGLEKLRQEGYM
jgi:sulfate adenylyltransferase subunit 2